MTTWLFFIFVAVIEGIAFYIACGIIAKRNETIRIYEELQGRSSFDAILDVFSAELKRKKINVLGFFLKNYSTLDNGEHSITLMETNSAVKAFFTTKPCRGDARYPSDAAIMEIYKERFISFVPLTMRAEGSCWQLTNCEDIKCRAYRKKCCCWLESGRRCHGDDLETHEEKITKCLNCPVLAPVGVCVISGGRMNTAHEFLKGFEGVISNAVSYATACHAAQHDGLTGLLNKRSFSDTLAQSLTFADRYKQPLSLCMFDIDHFKKFNDTYGHQTGDIILRSLSKLITSAVRTVDIVCRYGGEEFTIIFPNTEKAVAVQISDKLRRAVEDHQFTSAHGYLHVTISMGVAAYPEDNITSTHDLISKADMALYHVKDTTRNRAVGYEPRMKGTPAKDRKKAAVQ